MAWRAEENKKGWYCLYMDGYRVRFYNDDGLLGDRKKVNAAVKELCESLGIPITPYDSGTAL